MAMTKKGRKKTNRLKGKYESPIIEKIKVSDTYKLSITAPEGTSGASSF